MKRVAIKDTRRIESHNKSGTVGMKTDKVKSQRGKFKDRRAELEKARWSRVCVKTLKREKLRKTSYVRGKRARESDDGTREVRMRGRGREEKKIGTTSALAGKCGRVM